MKDIATILFILLIGFGIYYFANEYAVTRQMGEELNELMMEDSFIDESLEGDYQENAQGDVQTGSQGSVQGNMQGKININEVCEGALIRMTFTNGAAAEKFVAECKEGKHPEVIEQFKVEMNLGDGAQI